MTAVDSKRFWYQRLKLSIIGNYSYDLLLWTRTKSPMSSLKISIKLFNNSLFSKSLPKFYLLLSPPPRTTHTSMPFTKASIATTPIKSRFSVWYKEFYERILGKSFAFIIPTSRSAFIPYSPLARKHLWKGFCGKSTFGISI